MPVGCLAGYITRTRSAVTQPVTADDDYTFYAGQNAVGGDRAGVKPDTILPLLDFVSIHMYPISNYGQWNWQQIATPAGPARAAAMMNAALATAKANHDAVANYQYTDNTGSTVTVGASLPIVVGETGWKAVQTNPSSAIEAVAATPVNAKWYFDLLYGNPATAVPAWERSNGGPVAIFYFEMTDESWKTTDDGWGLWDKDRIARYALCGTPVGPACNTNVYEGAGYFGAPPPGGGASGNTGTCTGACIDFASAGVLYEPFEGLVSAAQADDPVDGTNKVARFVKGPTGQPWAGATVYTVAADKSVPAFDLSGSKVVTLRVYAPAAGQTVRLKLEDAANGAISIEKDALTTKANEWETLSFDFAAPDVGTYNPANTYNKVSLFPLFSTTAPPASDTTYYFDELQYTAVGGGGGGGTLVNGVYADDYVGDLPATAQSTLGGDVGFFFDGRLAVGVGATYDYAGVSGTAQDPQGVHNFYYGLGLDLPAITDAYFGAFVKAPGNGVVDVSGYTNILVNVWGPDQLFQAGTFPALDVILQGPAVGGCGSASGASEVVATFNTTAQGAAQIYTLPLASFTLSFACSGETTAAEVLANIAQVNVVLKGTNIQYVNMDPGNVAFTNGLNIGSIKFN
jgi:hypothetical protein